MPERLEAVSTLPDASDTFACVIDADSADAHTAERWARAVIERAPALLRCFIVAGWVGGLWLRLGPRRAPDHILGWRIMSNTPSVVVFGVESFTLTARLVVEVDASSVVHATFVRYDRRLGRVAWRVAAPLHRRVIPFLLQRASRILAVSAGTS